MGRHYSMSYYLRRQLRILILHNNKKKRSHPYKKRAINNSSSNNKQQKGKKHSVASILTSRTNLTQSPSHSGHSSNVPTYPQQYVPNKKAMIEPIIEYSYSQTSS